MVSTSVLQAIILGIGTIAVGLLTAGFRVWKHVESLNGDDDENRIEELQDERRSDVSDEVKTLFIDIEEYLDENPHSKNGERDYDDHVVTVIDNHVDPDELNSLVEKAENINRPAELYNRHKNAYGSCYGYLFRSSVSAIGLNVIIASALIFGEAPFGGVYLILESLFAVASAIYAYESRDEFRYARNIKKKFDEEWENYRYKY